MFIILTHTVTVESMKAYEITSFTVSKTMPNHSLGNKIASID